MKREINRSKKELWTRAPEAQVKENKLAHAGSREEPVDPALGVASKGATLIGVYRKPITLSYKISVPRDEHWSPGQQSEV